jgi:large subunit ribosomal protein L22
MLKGMPVPQAEVQLQYLPGRAVRDVVLAVLRSAVANAEHNQGITKEALKVASVVVDSAFAMKRFRPASRGTAHPFVKRTSHITVTLEGLGSEEKKAAKKGQAKKEIVTITADQYAAEALDDDVKEKHETAPKSDKEVATEKDVPKSKEQQTFGKMRGLQGGGDKKKSFRRKSIG